MSTQANQDGAIHAYRLDLEHILSQDRLAAYSPDSNDDLETVTNYFWNIALCQSLYSCLGSLEVAVRNSIHTTLTEHFQRPDWYDVPGTLQRRETANIIEAKSKIHRAGKHIVPGRVVAALSFGFWTSLLDALYGNAPSGPQLWASPNSPLLIRAFPHAEKSARGVRRPTFNRLDDARLLRNRVFHYERIYHGVELPARKRKASPRHITLLQMHADIMEMIGWIDPTLQRTSWHLDTFRRTWESGYAQIQDEIRSLIKR